MATPLPATGQIGVGACTTSLARLHDAAGLQCLTMHLQRQQASKSSSTRHPCMHHARAPCRACLCHMPMQGRGAQRSLKVSVRLARPASSVCQCKDGRRGMPDSRTISWMLARRLAPRSSSSRQRSSCSPLVLRTTLSCAWPHQRHRTSTGATPQNGHHTPHQPAPCRVRGKPSIQGVPGSSLCARSVRTAWVYKRSMLPYKRSMLQLSTSGKFAQQGVTCTTLRLSPWAGHHACNSHLATTTGRRDVVGMIEGGRAPAAPGGAGAPGRGRSGRGTRLRCCSDPAPPALCMLSGSAAAHRAALHQHVTLHAASATMARAAF